MQPEEQLFAYLNDIYVLCLPERTRSLYNLLKGALKKDTGLDLNEKKTRVCNRVGKESAGMRQLSADV